MLAATCWINTVFIQRHGSIINPAGMVWGARRSHDSLTSSAIRSTRALNVSLVSCIAWSGHASKKTYTMPRFRSGGHRP